MENQALETIQHNLLFEIRSSIRYHNHRKRFFDSFHNVASFLTAISGTAIFMTILTEQSNPALQMVLAAVIAIFSTIDLVISSSAKSREYEDLSRRFIALEKKIMVAENPDSKFFKSVQAEKLSIEADEPPHLRILNAVCFNETITAMGLNKDEKVKIEWYQRLFKNFADLNPGKI